MPTVSITNYENLPGAVGIVFVPAVENHVVAQLHLRLHFFDPVREVVAMATMYHLSGTVGSVHWAERNEEGQRRGIVVTCTPFDRLYTDSKEVGLQKDTR